MSLVTGFNFRAFECDATRHRDGAVKEGVSLSVLTSEDMKRLAVCKVTIPCGKENPNAPWQQVAMRGEAHATFWDTSMGNFDLKPFPAAACTTCSNSAEGGRGVALNQRCSGHYGYIAMPSIGDEGGSMVVYNPIMFRDLCGLLRAQCFSCHNFRIAPVDTMRWYLAFELFDLGLTAEALAFLETFKSTAANTIDAPAAGEAAQDDNDGREKSTKKSRAEKPTGKVGKEAVAHSGIDMMKKHAAQTIRAAQAAGRLPTGADRDATLRTVIDIRNQIASQAFSELAGAGKTCTHCGAESPSFAEKDGQLYLKLSKLAIDKLVAGGHMTPETKEEYLTEMRVFSRERVLLPAHQALQHIVNLTAKQTDLLGKLLYNVGTATVNVEFRNPLPAAECYKALFLDCILVPPVNVRLASGVKVQEGGALAPDERTKSLSHILTFVHEIEAYYRLRQGSTPTLRQQIGNEANVRNLQLHVDKAYDGVLSSFAKKEGLFRMHMMGKRVNQACRSVISPDFTVEPNEVLVPRPFARNLSYPEQLTFHDPARTALLRKCIINGPGTYPGASHVEVHDSDKTLQTFALSDNARDASSRTARADAAFAAAKQGRKVIIHRHLLDGDRIIFNRQPTLHRPSMQSYEARVLSSLKTLRFHYVSGKSYNADFDGDEMNVHVPQSLECRAELAVIMDSNLNYLVPTSGRPIRGLIQDHCAAGVFLTMRDRFFVRDEFMQLLFLGLQPYLGNKATLDLDSLMPVPAILKPRPMWTGKQMVSVLLRFVTGVDGSAAGNQGIFTKGSSMTYTSTWTTRDGSTVASHPMGDEPLLVMGSELIVGVLDKNQLGPSNLSIAHLINEVYGPHHVGRFFGALGRVLTYSLQRVGFSMGMEDMILLDSPGRRKAMRDIDLCVLGVSDEGKALSTVSKAASALNGNIFPTKLRMHFPHNDLVTMTQSGAKGSNTNAIQMALTLGQQTFSGQRIGAMTSGKTAPSFFKGETRARSKGFAMGRFVSGIRPAEYTIHAMAGRDGLIDTAVKTARSGYLQRCLVKGLESLTAHWDGTVRDASGAVVQFKLGGDGLDPCKASTLTEFNVVFQNRADLARRFKVGKFAPEAAAEDCFDSDDDAGEKPMSGKEWQRAGLEREQSAPLPLHIDARLRRQTYELDLKPRTVQRWRAKGVLADKVDAEQQKASHMVEEITKARLARGGSEPGEPVGIVAAQAAGEPSTQMTLNTFHQAGQTVTHVTEGIPRLRELLMFASVAQPAVIVPVTSCANGELEVVQTIIGRLTPKRLDHALAPLAKPYRWAVTRHETGATLSVVMLFSTAALDRLRKASGSSMHDHVVSFGAALRSFSKRVCMRLKGVVRQAATSVRTVVTDPAAMLNGDEEGDEVHVRRAGDDDDDDRSAAPEGAAAAPADDDARSATPAPGGARGGDDDNNNDDDDDDEDDDGAGRKANAGDEDDDEDDDDDAAMVHQLLAKQGAGRGSASALTYTRFPALDDYFVGGSMHSVVTPAAASQFIDGAGIDKAVLDDLCAARFVITMPGTVVSVIPDILRECLTQVTFPTSNAQVAEALWLPDKGKDSGQLILQGEGAKLKTAMRVVAPFADRCPGINVRGITSTDVRDIAETFGIEAAYDFLAKELVKLFKRHSVDARHCSLIADAATFRGIWHAFNFNGMIAHSSSPLFQMTFASSRKFLERAISRGVPDNLNSFSAAIMVGERPHVGTGTVGLSVDADVIQATVAERPSRGGPKPMRPAAGLPPPL